MAATSKPHGTKKNLLKGELKSLVEVCHKYRKDQRQIEIDLEPFLSLHANTPPQRGLVLLIIEILKLSNNSERVKIDKQRLDILIRHLNKDQVRYSAAFEP